MFDESIEEWTAEGSDAFLGACQDIEAHFEQLRRDKSEGVKMLSLYKRNSTRGFNMSLLRISKNSGAFDLGTHSSYGFEMGLVLRGRGILYTKRHSVREDYKQVHLDANKAICFSRHRSHCLVAQSDIEALHFTVPYDERRFRSPTHQLVSA
jgi:hypothetical protein